MAKARGKKPTTKNTQRGTRGVNDAQRLAAIRWLAMRIEQVSIEILVTDRDKFDQVENALREQIRLLQRMGRPLQEIEGAECPEGYVLCRGGLCAPMCDDFDTIAAAKSARRGKATGRR